MITSDEATKTCLKNYKYSGQDRSILASSWSKLCAKIHPFLVPNYVSPNVVTLVGLFAVLSNVVYLYNAPKISTFEFLSAALSLFIYQVCDTFDGLQGRLVGMYHNVTTEIFDHGCDSIVTTLACLQVSMLFQLPLAHSMIIFLALALVFFLPTWEHQWTKVMIFRGGIMNPTEGLFAMELFYMLCALFPPLDFQFSTMQIAAFVLVFASFIIRDLESTIARIRAKHPTFGFSNFTGGWLPMIFTIRNAFIISQYGQEQDKMILILCVAIPWNLAILALIFAEITSNRYESSKNAKIVYRMILGLQFIFFLMVMYGVDSASWIVYLKVASCAYAGLWYNIVTIACDALNMPNFYTIMSV